MLAYAEIIEKKVCRLKKNCKKNAKMFAEEFAGVGVKNLYRPSFLN